MKALSTPLMEIAGLEELYQKRFTRAGYTHISGCISSQKTHMVYGLSDGFDIKIIVLSSEEKAKQWVDEWSSLEARSNKDALSESQSNLSSHDYFVSPRSNTLFYPAKDLLFFHTDVQADVLYAQRLEVYRALLERQAKGKVDDAACRSNRSSDVENAQMLPESSLTIVTTADVFLESLPPLPAFEERIIRIEADGSIDLTTIQQQLVKIGFERVSQVEAPGEMAVRGGILDIYPIGYENPVRIELWGDEIDSIRFFSVDNQRSLEALVEETLLIYPAKEEMAEEKARSSFAQYLTQSKAKIWMILDEPTRLLEALDATYDEYEQAIEGREESGILAPEDRYEVFTPKQVIKTLQSFTGLLLTALDAPLKEFPASESVYVQAQGVSPYHNSFDMLTKDLRRYKREGYRVVLVSPSVSRAKRLAVDLLDYEVHSFYSEDLEREVKPSEVMVCLGQLAGGYAYPMIKYVVIAESDIFGTRKKRKRKRTLSGERIQDFTNLKIGDYVVHENHGLGVYQGIEQIVSDKITKDYIKISYADGGNLYVLATQLDLIQKYASSDAKPPKLNKLGTVAWSKTKASVKAAVDIIAQDLVELYAHRQDGSGHAFGPDTVWQKEFEELFPFEETPDQLDAIADTKKDMESNKIMDRLVCGDVGYGKTEVAIRAAFKAVSDGKQVVYLCPTTILAQQHFHTFVQRMRDYPVRIDLLCRFRTATQIANTLKDVKKGQVDILIGTHRVLSKDVSFKDLGLLIIDEEQRFGVRHKEKIKQMKESIDVLTLTATPIPRTLHMSLIGVRDLSVLEEAPQDRLPIQTYIMEYQEEMVREAIARELSRGGQVYYVYNRVSDIADVAGRIQKMVPEANVAFAHGQMGERHLENIMMDFVQGDLDVLVSTTIVETGLDISNANTMIIHDADRFGLSQLYQLRGRIGRSNRLAYAFLLYRRGKLLAEVAEKRLSAIREFSDLGSGVKIAMRDLEIRGAGNLLGEAQSGHMAAVGYDMYCKMLNLAVKEVRGEHSEEAFETSIDLNLDAYIPDSYIRNATQKLDVYKRIAAIANEEEMDEMLEELIDRFGNIPKQAHLLLRIAAIKALAHDVYITSITQKGAAIHLELYEKAALDPAKFPLLLSKYPSSLRFQNAKVPYFRFELLGDKNKQKDDDVLNALKTLFEDMKQGLL